MDKGQPLEFDAKVASGYLRSKTDVHGTVHITVGVGSGAGQGVAWGCDLSYDYVKYGGGVCVCVGCEEGFIQQCPMHHPHTQDQRRVHDIERVVRLYTISPPYFQRQVFRCKKYCDQKQLPR